MKKAAEVSEAFFCSLKGPSEHERRFRAVNGYKDKEDES